MDIQLIGDHKLYHNEHYPAKPGTKNTGGAGMTEEEIISIIIEEAIYIPKSIGPGMLENVYKTCLAYRLSERGFYVEIEKPIPVVFEEIKIECGYRADIVVDEK